MTEIPSFPTSDLFSLDSADLVPRAIDVFRFQYRHNSLYREFSDALGVRPEAVRRIGEIPFLPVGFFKTHEVRTGAWAPEVVFESSGTTGMVTSRHPVRDAELYRRSYMTGFEQFYGDVRGWCIIGLLPAYLERSHSSLVFMVQGLIRASGHPESGFYLYEHEKLCEVLGRVEAAGQ
jgi:hypothetical protein